MTNNRDFVVHRLFFTVIIGLFSFSTMFLGLAVIVATMIPISSISAMIAKVAILFAGLLLIAWLTGIICKNVFHGNDMA